MSSFGRIIVLLAAFAIFFALVFPLAPTPRPLGKRPIVLALALAAAFGVAVPMWSAVARLQLIAADPLYPQPVEDLSCVRLC